MATTLPEGRNVPEHPHDPSSRRVLLVVAVAVFVAGLLATAGVFSRLRALELARLQASLERSTKPA
jgi:hypothetical protein